MCKSWGFDTRLYNMPPSRNVACIGLVGEGVSAVALLERIDQHVFVWDISCNDFESGTRLVRAMSRQPPDVLVLGHTLHPRWKIANMYFMKDVGTKQKNT
jgi:hypothetical protein